MPRLYCNKIQRNLLVLFVIFVINQEWRKFLVVALPLRDNNNGCNNNATATDDAWMNNTTTTTWCPNLQKSVDNQNLPKCLSKKCPESTVILGIETNLSTNAKNLSGFSAWESCDNYFLIPVSLFKLSLVCLPKNVYSVQLLIKSRFNDSTSSFCILNIQQYTYEANCDIKLENDTISPFPSLKTCRQIIYDCTKEQELLKELQKSKSKQEFKKLLKEESLPLVSNSKNTELRREERQVYRRMKKPVGWNWRNYVAEITLASVLLCILFLVLLRKCLTAIMMSFRRHSHSRVVRFESDEVSEEKRRLSTYILTSPQRRQIDFNKNPSKPILKNANNNTKNNNKKKPQTSNHHRNGLDKTTSKSFDSNSSIYYDALEGLVSVPPVKVEVPPVEIEEETETSKQPLISAV